MDLASARAFGERHRRTLLLADFLVLAGALALVLDRPKGAGEAWLALPLFLAGGAVAAWLLWPSVAVPAAAKEPTLATRLIRRLTLGGRLTRLFPVAGVALILGDLYYNLVLSASPAFLTEDIIVLLTAGALLGYGFVPERLARERDFVLLFFLAMTAILVVPILGLRAVTGNLDASVDAYSWVALAPETAALLSLVGVPASVQAVAGFTAPGLVFTPQNVPTVVTLVITTSCSGIYSFGIFASAFLSFVLTEARRPTRRMGLFLALGLVAAYFANLLRMVVIVLVGYYTDTPATDMQNMLVAHSYAGWAIFLAWMALFWGLLFKFMPMDGTRAAEKSRRPVSTPRRGTNCAICGESLSPAIPAARCTCGALMHRTCVADAGRCPTCGASKTAILAPAAGSS